MDQPKDPSSNSLQPTQLFEAPPGFAPQLPAELVETPPGSRTLENTKPPAAEAVTVSAAAVEARTQTGLSNPRVPVGIHAYEFPHHEVHESIGQGGMGVVFRATQRIAKRDVALKTLNSTVKGEDRLCKRFKLEAEAVARLQHENIVQIYEVGEVETDTDTRLPYFTMEYVPAGTLSQRLRKGPKLSFTEIAPIARQLANALQAAHDAGVTHRDIKPSNVLLTAQGCPKLTDFGLAMVTDVTMDTLSNALLGTPSYMSPEQASGRNKDVGPSSDVYSLGATLYEMLVGRAPFEGQNNFEIAQRVIQDEPPRPRNIKPDIPAGLEAICLKCLEKEPKARYATAKDLAEDLGRWERGEETVARPLTATRRAMRWAGRNKVALALVAVFGVLTYAAAMGLQKKDDNGTPTVKGPKTRTAEEWVKALDSGPLTIIPTVGLPEYVPDGDAWWFGEGSLVKSNTGDGTTSIEKTSSGLYKLMPKTGRANYRVSLELQHVKMHLPAGEVGIALGVTPFQTPGGRDMVQYLGLVFSDFYDEAEKALLDGAVVLPPGQPQGNHRMIAKKFVTVLNVEGLPKDFHTSFASIPFVPAEVQIRNLKNNGSERRLPPWRKMVLDVSPDFVDVEFETAPGVMVRKRIPQKDLEDTKRADGLMKSKIFQEAVTLPVWSAQGGIGLYVHNSMVNVRNVAVEPK